MRDLEEIRKKKLQEMQFQMNNQQEQQKEQEAEIQIESILRQILSPKAKSRLTNIKLVNKQKYMQVVQSLLYISKIGKLNEKISDEQLKKLLEKIQPKKKEIKIRRA